MEASRIFEGEKMSVPTFDRRSNSDSISYYHGVALLDFKETGVNINAERYETTLKRLRVIIKNKRRKCCHCSA